MTSNRMWARWLVLPGLFGLVALACGQATTFNGETVVGLQTAPPPPPPSSAPPAPTPPPAPPPRVEVQVGKIQINEKIQFDVGQATIRAESNGLLDEIAQVIAKNPTIKKIQVEGHSSSEGDAKANLKLSDDRAKAVVQALEKRGVAKGVLVAKGFGATAPIDPGPTDEARERNRRVEFVILDPATPRGATADAGAPKPQAAPAKDAGVK